MIYFYCPACDEELEGEDSIRGTRMACPACGREIEVPQVGVKVTPVRPPTRTRIPGRGRSASSRRARFVVTVLLACFVGLLAVSGLAYYVNRQFRQPAGPSEACSVCAGKKKVPCVRCGGSRVQPCAECGGSGTRKNFRNEDEKCFVCNGQGRRDCHVCGGAGAYDCSGCGGTGVRGGQPASEPRTFK